MVNVSRRPVWSLNSSQTLPALILGCSKQEETYKSSTAKALCWVNICVVSSWNAESWFVLLDSHFRVCSDVPGQSQNQTVWNAVSFTFMLGLVRVKIRQPERSSVSSMWGPMVAPQAGNWRCRECGKLSLLLCVNVSFVPEPVFVWWLKGGQKARREKESSKLSQGIY